MFTITSSSDFPVTYHSCGNLQNANSFLHSKRTLNSFVLIAVRRGTLYITQDNIAYEVNSGQYIILLPHTQHFGTKPSNSILSYDWLHFTFNSGYQVSNTEAVETTINKTSEPNTNYNNNTNSNNNSNNDDNSYYQLNITGNFNIASRIPALFSQLLDFSVRPELPKSALNYCASMLLLLLSADNKTSDSKSSIIFSIQQWIRANYTKEISLSKVAEHFNYNPDYLSNLFQKETGTTFIHFLHTTRIQAAKNLLVNQNITIREVAYSCGFPDEKYFMRIFKKLEHLTPSQYRASFNRKHINSR